MMALRCNLPRSERGATTGSGFMKASVWPVLMVLLAAFAQGDRPSRSVEPVGQDRADLPYRGYWLTIAGDRNEYRTLLVTRGSIETLAGHSSWSALPFDNSAMTFRTYGTDSMWNKPFACVQKFGDVDAKTRTANVDGVAYVYEPCSVQDVIRLLENPDGTIPIHRMERPLGGARQTAKAFCLLLREQMKAEEVDRSASRAKK
jgi:hypothetical protein